MTHPHPSSSPTPTPVERALSFLTGGRALVAASVAVSATLAATVSVPALLTDLDRATQARASAAQIQTQLDQAARVSSDPRAAKKLKGLRTQIPATSDIGTFTAEMQAAAATAGAQWISSEQSQAEQVELDAAATTQLESYEVAVTLQADATSVATFTGLVQKSDRLVRVDAISAQAHRAVVTLTVFAMPMPGEEAK